MKKILVLSLILLSVPGFCWDIVRNKKGALTGYSTPISSDVFKDLGLDPNDKKQRLRSPNVTTDLFSAPQTNYDYDTNNVLRKTTTSGMGARTGVTIIYD